MLEVAYNQLISQTSDMRADSEQLKLTRLIDDYYQNIIENKKGVFGHIKSIFKADSADKLLKGGIYIWGEVGRGKSMIVDLFFNNITAMKKKRTHFHKFMSEFHKALHEYNYELNDKQSQNDAILDVIKIITSDAQIVILDELQVNNIADAMVLQRLFQGLFDYGIMLLITSNFPPEQLFVDGLQRENFLPCIDLIMNQMEVFCLNNHIDYRLSKITAFEKLYYWPINNQTAESVEMILRVLTGDHKFAAKRIEIEKNRELEILNTYGNVAMFSFIELCKISLGVLDYIAICNNFSTILVTDIPQMTSEDHNEALRFITLIDCIYEKKNKLICTADVYIDNLYIGTKHKIEFQRTVSRLHEMQSVTYLGFNKKHEALWQSNYQT